MIHKTGLQVPPTGPVMVTPPASLLNWETDSHAAFRFAIDPFPSLGLARCNTSQDGAC